MYAVYEPPRKTPPPQSELPIESAHPPKLGTMDTRGGHGKPAGASRDAAAAQTWRAALRAECRRPRNIHDALRLAAWAYLGLAIVLPIFRITVGFDALALPFIVAPALAIILWVAPRQDHFRTWLLYAVGIYFFTQLRDAADESSIQASTGYVLDWERWMFGGDTPSAWLQQRIGGANGNPGVLAYYSTFVHWSWFFFPHLTVVGAYFWARPMFFRVAGVMLGIFYTGVVMYFLVPTIPPWLATEQGDATGIVRIMQDVGPTLFGQSLWDDLFKLAAEPNPRAAMPSLHFAAAFQMVLIGLLLRSPRLTAAATLYSFSLAFGLMYLGEHYFADILVGGLAALVSFFIVERALGGPGLPFRMPRWRRRRLPHAPHLARPTIGPAPGLPDIPPGRERQTAREGP